MKAALIGYGYWGEILHKYLLENKEIELVGICSPHYEATVSLEKLIEQKIDCAFVCTPIETHFAIVRELLNAGIHVFCEKPLCKNYEQTRELITLAKKKNVVLFTDYIYTYSPSIQFIKENLNKYGAVNFIDMEISQFGNFYKNDDVFEVLGVHLLSVLVYWFPNLEIKTEKIISIKKDFDGKIVAGMVFLRAGNEIEVCIKCSLVSSGKTRVISLYCQNGMMKFDMQSNDTVVLMEYGQIENGYEIQNKNAFTFDEADNLKTVMKSFINGIKDNILLEKNVNVSRRVACILEQIKAFSN